jgi:hypothetical protein
MNGSMVVVTNDIGLVMLNGMVAETHVVGLVMLNGIWYVAVLWLEISVFSTPKL